MLKAVSNTSPVIYLVKIGVLSEIFHLFEKLLIPPHVYEEIKRGHKKHPEEVSIVESLIEQKKIRVIELNDESTLFAKKLIKKTNRLHLGEVAAIALAKQEGVDIILMDDKVGHEIAKLYSLKPLRTTALLLLMLKRGKIKFREFKDLLIKLVTSGYYITADLYENLLNYARIYAEE